MNGKVQGDKCSRSSMQWAILPFPLFVSCLFIRMTPADNKISVLISLSRFGIVEFTKVLEMLLLDNKKYDIYVLDLNGMTACKTFKYLIGTYWLV